MNVDPFQLPGGGPNFNKFGDDVLYEFNIDNNGDAVADVKYQFRFKTTYANPNTFLYNTNQVTSVDDPDLNRKQTYNITEVRGKTSTVIGKDLPTAPAHVGALRSTPNYAATANGASIKLKLAAPLRKGDAVTVRWQGLVDEEGATLTGITGPLTAK